MPSFCFPLCKMGIKGNFVFKSLPASLYKGRSEKTLMNQATAARIRDYGLRD